MKHVFVVHSHTTFLISMAAISKLSLAKDDVILLYGRKYSISCVDVPYRVLNMDDIYYHKTSGLKFVLSPKEQKKYEKEVDYFIDNQINDDYAFYTPHLCFPAFQLILTNPRCKKLNLIQEAAVTWFDKSFSFNTFIKNSLVLFNQRLWYRNNWFLPDFIYGMFSDINTFALTETYWSPLHHTRHIVVEMPRYDLNVNFNSSKPIFVFEASVEHKQIEKIIFMKGCEKLISECKEDINYVKFHPAQTDDNKKQILSMFGNSKVEELPMGVPFELILSSYKNLKVYGFTTSLIVYAYDMGHKVICRARQLGEKSKMFHKYIISLGLVNLPVYNNE